MFLPQTATSSALIATWYSFLFPAPFTTFRLACTTFRATLHYILTSSLYTAGLITNSLKKKTENLRSVFRTVCVLYWVYCTVCVLYWVYCIVCVLYWA